jgi:hypothetical protein
MTHVGFLKKKKRQCLAVLKKQHFRSMLFLDGTKHCLTLDQGSLTNYVCDLGIFNPIPSEPFISRGKMSSKTLLWISKSLVLNKPACYLLPPYNGPQLYWLLSIGKRLL